jgi:L-seryl-tRNA(Ser) seleniumtransferase
VSDPRRHVPRTDTVLADERLAAAVERLGADAVKRVVHATQDRVRTGLIPPEDIVGAALENLPLSASSLRPVLNATGVILHTNLGRAALSAAAVHSLVDAAGYVDVEYDVVTGVRSSRGRSTLDALLALVPNAEDALIVNNGAGALVLAATSLAAGREIVVSRGELVEIGDGFRLSELLVSTGSRLREVGTTNRTNLADYQVAVGPSTGFLLKVHPSNFVMRGFTSSVSVRELASLGLPIVADIGSGLLVPDRILPDEPHASGWLEQGATLVVGSGDKLLGGPQAGLILGRRDVIHQLRRHPLARALRVDKLTLAALEATLMGPPTPTYLSLHAAPDELRARAERLANRLTERGNPVSVVASDGVVGGGGAPGLVLPGWAIELPEEMARPLRAGEPCIVTRVERGRCLLDLRCIAEREDVRLESAVLAVAKRLDPAGEVD